MQITFGEPEDSTLSIFIKANCLNLRETQAITFSIFIKANHLESTLIVNLLARLIA